MFYYITRPPYPNELYHHGVKGQKWGVVHEYKLKGRKSKKKKDSIVDKAKDKIEDATTATKKAAKSVSKTAKKVEKKVDAAIDKAEKVASEAALDALEYSGGAGWYLSKHIRAQMYEKERSTAKNVDKNGVKLQDPPPKTIKENLDRTNPNFYTMEDEWTNNCTNCAMTFEARRRGYEVQAEAIVGRTPKETFNVLKEVYEGADVNPVWDFDWENLPEGWPSTEEELELYYELAQEIIDAAGPNNENLIAAVMEEFSKEPPGSRGMLTVMWSTGGGHAMNYEIDKNGELILYCPQTDTVWKGKEAIEFFRSVCTVSYTRLDNCKLDSKDLIKDGVSK